MSFSEGKEIDMKYNLYQRFYVIGIDTDIVFSDELYKNPKSKNIFPKVISKFPLLSKTFSNIPDDLISRHCFPNGFSLVEGSSLVNSSSLKDHGSLSKDAIPKLQTFLFTLDNIPLNIIEEGIYSKMHFTGILFYESLAGYYELKVKRDGKNENDENAKIIQENCEKYFIPKVICLSSVLSFPKQTLDILKDIHAYYSTKNPVDTPIEQKIENLIFSIAIPPRSSAVYSFTPFKTKYEFSQSSVNKLQTNSIPLMNIYNCLVQEEVMKIIKCILLEVPIIFFSVDKERLTSIIEGLLSLIFPFQYQYPNISILPTNCYSLIEIFPSFVLGINEPYTEGFFRDNNIEIDDKIIVIVNLDSKNTSDNNSKTILIEKSQITEEPYIYLNYEDKTKTKKNSDEVLNIIENVDLPPHYKKKINQSVILYLKKIRGKGSKTEEKDVFNQTIREKFFYFIVSIFKDYSSYLRLSEDNLKAFDAKYIKKKADKISVDDVYDIQAFLKAYKSEPFYRYFINTKMFVNFICKKIYPQNIYDKLEILLFDEKIVEKKNRNTFKVGKGKTPFLDWDGLKDYATPMTINQSRRPFTKDEFLFMLQNKEKALEYYQEFSIIQKESKNKEIINEVNISYPVFPKLLFDNKYFKNSYEKRCTSQHLQIPALAPNSGFESLINGIIINPQYLDVYKDTDYNFNLFEKSALFKSSLGRNYVTLTWLVMVSGTLWYCDTFEREVRVEEIFDYLKTLEYIEEDALEFLYLVLIHYGTDAQVIKIYENLIKYEKLANNYMNFSLLCNKLTKAFNNNKNLNLNKNKANRPTLILREGEFEKEKVNKQGEFEFRKRSLLNDGSDNEEIQFENVHTCEFCHKDFEVDYSKVLNISKTAFDLQIPCTFCGSPISKGNLQINVMIGDNENTIESFTLMTPFEMFEVSKIFLKNSDLKIKVENLKQSYSKMFYNLVFYFSLKKLNFDFLIPYEKNNSFGHRERFENLAITKEAAKGDVIPRGNFHSSSSMALFQVPKEDINKAKTNKSLFGVKKEDFGNLKRAKSFGKLKSDLFI